MRTAWKFSPRCYRPLLEQHRGFLLKEFITHGNSIGRLEAMLRTGGQLLNEHGQYVNNLQRPLREFFETPHYAGLTREVALSRLGSWVGVLFLHEPARFGFRPSEQRLLLTALRGGTDQELSGELAISLSAVTKDLALDLRQGVWPPARFLFQP